MRPYLKSRLSVHMGFFKVTVAVDAIDLPQTAVLGAIPVPIYGFGVTQRLSVSNSDSSMKLIPRKTRNSSKGCNL
jgi:hypothetical protein